MTHKKLWIILALLLLALIAAVVSRAWPLLFPPTTISIEPDPDCDLRVGPCSSRVPGKGALSFSIEPRHIPLVKPLQLQVTVDGFLPAQVEVDISGVNMYMGYNRVKLDPMDGGRFQGIGRIPVCTLERMEWEAKVLLQTPEGLIAVPFRFTTLRNGS